VFRFYTLIYLLHITLTNSVYISVQELDEKKRNMKSSSILQKWADRFVDLYQLVLMLVLVVFYYWFRLNTALLRVDIMLDCDVTNDLEIFFCRRSLFLSLTLFPATLLYLCADMYICVFYQKTIRQWFSCVLWLTEQSSFLILPTDDMYVRMKKIM
jgi:hypothetical protein